MIIYNVIFALICVAVAGLLYISLRDGDDF